MSSGAPSRIVPFPSPVSRPYDLLCFVLYGAQNQTLPETPPLAAPRITVVGSYATGLTMKIQGLPAPKLTFVMFFSGWLFWAFAQHRSASASGLRRPYRIIYSIFQRFNLEWKTRTLNLFTQAA